MINELYLYSYVNEPNKSPWRERLWALLPLRETATFPPQADHVLVVFFFGRGGTWGAALKPPDIWSPEEGTGAPDRDQRIFGTCTWTRGFEPPLSWTARLRGQELTLSSPQGFVRGGTWGAALKPPDILPQLKIHCYFNSLLLPLMYIQVFKTLSLFYTCKHYWKKEIND